MAQIVLLMPVANRFDRVSIRIPNGLLAIAALPVASGYSVKIIDLKIDTAWKKTLEASLDHETLCVGISCSTGRMIKSAREIARATRHLRPDLPIVLGGPHPTLMPEQTLSSPDVDIVVINEGDITFHSLVEALASKKPLAEIAGIGYKRDGTIHINPQAKLIRNLDELKPLPYHLVDVKKYSSLTVDGLPSIDLVTSRGCPFNCGFCSTPTTSHRLWRAHSVDTIIQSIQHLYHTYGVRTFYFSDDNFMVDLGRVERFVDALSQANLSIHWGSQGVRVDTINAMSGSLLDKIERSGCAELSIGVESASAEILKTIDKQITVADVLRANEKLAGRAFAVKYNFIIGFPGESLSDIRQTVRLAIRLYRKNPRAWFPFNVFTPFPGTPMFRKAVDHGFVPPKRFEEWEKLESVGWDRDFKHWMPPQETAILRSINCTSYLAFPAAIQKISHPLLRVIFQLYRPLAYFRFRKMAYAMHIEKNLLEIIDAEA